MASFVLDNLGRDGNEASPALATLRQWRRDPYAMARHLPLKAMPALRGLADYYYDWLDHPTYDAYWQAMSPRQRFQDITVPALNIGGWFDGFLRGTIRCYEGMRQQVLSPDATAATSAYRTVAAHAGGVGGAGLFWCQRGGGGY